MCPYSIRLDSRQAVRQAVHSTFAYTVQISTAEHDCMPAGFEQRPTWSKQNNGEEEQWMQDKQWLEDQQAVELVPLPTLLHDCLLQPIEEQVIINYNGNNNIRNSYSIRLLCH